MHDINIELEKIIHDMRRGILTAGIELVAKGLVAGTWGNISARIAKSSWIAITPSGRDYPTMKEEDIVSELNVDAKISFSEISPKFIRILDQFAPFGPGNMRPVFLSEDVSLVYPPKIVGTNHLVTCFKQNGNEKVFDAIGFNLGYFADSIKGKCLVDIVYTIETLVKDGKSYPQIRIKDILVKNNQTHLATQTETIRE